MFAAPEHLAVDDESGHSENADRLGCTADPVDLLPPLPRQISREARGVGARLRQHRADHLGILDVELAFPEALESDVVIAAQHCLALAPGVEHAAGGERRIPDLLRAADHETAFSRLAAAVHVAVANPPPLVRVALFLDHPAAV